MLANKHKIKVGEASLIGKVAETGEAQIALDSGTETTHFQNPLLPYTRSDIILPMRAGEHIIGVLDIQSDKANDFTQDDIATMQILADQISISIERVNLVQELTQSAARLEQTYQKDASSAWRAFLQRGPKLLGYRYEGIAFEPLTTSTQEGFETLHKNETTISEGENKNSSILAVPIRLRGQTLGTLKLNFQSAGIPQETVRLVEEAADRVALALENARLVQDTQLRAEREQTLSQITARIRETLDIDVVLQTAVREIKQSFDLDQAEVRLQLTEQPQKPSRQRKS
jgi:GAF domain-containing protein